MDNLAYDYYEEEPKYEILNGEVVLMSPTPVVNHNRASGNIFNVFKNYLKGRRCEPFYETDVYLSDTDHVIPDVVIVCDRSKTDNGKRVEGAPDLAVEILSPSTRNTDKTYKKRLYEKHGVKEYWLVDILSREVTVYVLRDGKYETENVYVLIPDDILEDMSDARKARIVTKFKTSLFDDLIIDLEEVFENLI